MAKSLVHWVVGDKGITTLTDDDYYFRIVNIGDGWCWSVWKINNDKATPVSPKNRVVRDHPRLCVHDARAWYDTLSYETRLAHRHMAVWRVE